MPETPEEKAARELREKAIKRNEKIDKLLGNNVIVDHINMISQTEVTENFSIKMTNVRKYRGKIERRKQKIKRLYE